MSGRAIGAALGAVVGFVIGGPAGAQAGFALGSTLGGILMPDKLGLQDQEGPRLSNLKITSSTYGVSINKVYGTYRIGGNIIWSVPIKEVKHVEEVEVGKGGSETYDVITYTYYVSMAIAFCEGPISAIRKVWADSVLIYDVSSGGTTAAYQASKEVSGQMTFYFGTATQEIDWYLQSYEPDTPAYRHIVYIVFNTFQLEKYGNRVPNITCEVLSDSSNILQENTVITKDFETEIGSITNYVQNAYINTPNLNSSNYLYPASIEDISNPSSVPKEGYATIFKYGLSGALVDYYEFDTGFRDTDVYNAAASGSAILLSTSDDTDNTKVWQFDDNLSIVNQWQIYSSNDFGWFAPSFIGYDDNQLFIAAKNTITTTDYNYIWSSALQSGSANIIQADPQNEVLIPYSELSDLFSDAPFACGDQKIVVISNFASSGVYIIRVWDTNGINLGEIDCSTILYKEKHFVSNIGTYVIDNNIYYHAVQVTSDSAEYILAIDLITRVVIYSRKIDCPTTNLYVGTGGVFVNQTIIELDSNRGLAVVYLDPALQSNQVTLSSICQDLFDRSNVDTYNLIETDLIFVDGLLTAGGMTARRIIEVLQVAYLFDLIEEDFIIKTKVRGSTSIATLYSKDMLMDGEIIHVRKLDTELPKSITIKYLNKDLDYQQGAQHISRINSTSDNNPAFDLPIVFTDTQAKKTCEILLYDAWQEKDSFKFSVDSSKITLYVGDIVTLDYENNLIDVRIIKITITSNKTLQCETVKEGSYVSNAIGGNTSLGFINSVLKYPLHAVLKVFNAPTLDNAIINSGGVYYAAIGEDNQWRGCEVFKSKDLGLTYRTIGAILSPIPIGVVASKLGSGTTYVLDNVNNITVTLVSGTLESITLEQLFNGKNYILLGDEILQYQLATDNLDGTFTLSKLLRGRRGTEWAVGTHVDHENFIFLANNIEFSPSTINVERLYRAVTFGLYLDSATTVSSIYDGTNLKPFAPANLHKKNLTIYWTRRDRYISGYFRSLPNSEAQEKYKIELYYLGILQLPIIELSDVREYTYSNVTYPNVDNIRVSQYSDNLLDYGYVEEVNV